MSTTISFNVEIPDAVNAFAVQMMRDTAELHPTLWEKIVCQRVVSSDATAKFATSAHTPEALEAMLLLSNWTYLQLAETTYLRTEDHLGYTNTIDLSKDIEPGQLSNLMITLRVQEFEDDGKKVHYVSGNISRDQVNNVPMSQVTNLVLNTNEDGKKFVSKILIGDMVRFIGTVQDLTTLEVPPRDKDVVNAEYAHGVYGLKYITVLD